MALVMKEREKGKEREKEKRLSMYKLEPYKTELRRDLIAKRREITRTHFLNREKTHDRRLGKTVYCSVVTIDTNKARGNIDVLRLVIRDLGWREYPFQRRDHNCDVMWHAISFNDQSDIYSGQVNKFPGAVECFHKVNLFRWLEFMKNLFPDEYNFFPRTWLLPQQFNDFAYEVRAMHEKKPKNKPVFIVKPSEGSQGDGIFLLRDPQHYTTNGRNHVVQEYLSNVFILDKFKFDLRIYVVLRSLEPLQFHINKEGLARFSTIPYEQPTNKNMHETYMHLTNYSLNKKSGDFKISDKDDEGSKRKLSAVFQQLEKMGHNTTVVWEKIEKMVTKTLIAVVGELKVEYQAAIPSGKPGPTCFQVLGFDVLLSKDLEPFLLEVNSNPSLSITEEHETPTGGVEYMISRKDEDVKRKLIRDTLILIAPQHKYTRKRRRRRRRRRHNNGEEEDMEVDGHTGTHRQRQNHRRERDISIKYMDMEDDKPERQKSIFDESEYYGGNFQKRFVRNETCRVFIEGEGEVFFTDSGPSNPKYFSDYREPEKQPTPPDNNNSNTNNSNKKGNKQSEVRMMDTSDRLPSVFFKTGDNPGDMILEEDTEESSPPRPFPFDLSLLDSSEDEEEEEETGLKEIFPTVYGETFTRERIIERLADIFISCLGVKGCLRLGPTMFRLFARKCRLNRKGITNAAIDILYIDMQRKWEYMNPDRTSGLGFLGFVSACYEIARRKFYDVNKHVMMLALVDFCEEGIKQQTLPPSLSPQRHLGRRERHRTSLTLFPRSTITSLEEESEKRLFDSPIRRQPPFLSDATLIMRERQQRIYLPRTVTHATVFPDE